MHSIHDPLVEFCRQQRFILLAALSHTACVTSLRVFFGCVMIEDYFLYTIQSGDTLTSIARRYNTTVQKLTELNHISDPDLIYAGTTLKIPRETLTS